MEIITINLLPEDTRISFSEKLQKTLRQIPTNELAVILGVAESTAKNYKLGLHRITLKQLRRLQIDVDLNVGLEASNKEFSLPDRILVTKDLMWFIGFWKGDNDDSDTRIGVCNIENTIIEKSYKILSCKLSKVYLSPFPYSKERAFFFEEDCSSFFLFKNSFY